MRTGLNHHSCAFPRVLAVFLTLGFAGQLSFSESGEEWRGLVVAPEERCAPYNADEYSYPQSVEPQIADRLGGVYSPYTCETFGELTETDIEHIVARSEAHDSGLCSASPERKREFSRDIRNLTLSAPHLNRNLKGAKDGEVGAPFAEFRTDSISEKLLLDAMQLRDLLPYAKLEVEGYELDFALLEQGIKLNIEVDGDQHLDARGRQRRQDLTRDRVLVKLGWTVLRIPAWRCHEEIGSVIDEIRKMQDQLLD